MGSVVAARDTHLGVSLFWMLADAHHGFSRAEIVLLCRGRCREDSPRKKQSSTNTRQPLGKTQEEAKVIKAQFYATFIWLLGHNFSLLPAKRTL